MIMIIPQNYAFVKTAFRNTPNASPANIFLYRP
jgi:hypothetical protein